MVDDNNNDEDNDADDDNDTAAAAAVDDDDDDEQLLHYVSLKYWDFFEIFWKCLSLSSKRYTLTPESQL